MLSPHNDLLNAEPETEESIAALIEEIKNRARVVFAAGNYPEAEHLYDKGISVKADAVLYANRSAVRLYLLKYGPALEDADLSVSLDAKYTKGYYRKGQAHSARQEHQLAYEAFEKGRQLEPGNKTFAAMAEKAKKEAEKQKSWSSSSVAADATPMEVDAPKETSTVTASKNVTSTESKPATDSSSSGTASKIQKEPKKEADDDHEEDLSSDNLRGYKTLADGRKTTYFNKELTEEEKKLIGDIRPKKLDAPQAVTGDVSKTGTNGSAWNYAGTFEERNMTEWAKRRLKELVGGASHVIPGFGAVVDVNKVSDVDGDASITFIRGKKKFLYDLTFTVDWEAELDCGKAKGTLKYLDVTPDCDEDEYETQVEVDESSPREARHIVDRYVKSKSDGLQKEIAAKLHEFLSEYKRMG